MSDPKIVDSYNVTIAHRDGFEFVVVAVLTNDQQTQSFELAPAFARALSDDLLRAAAKAALNPAERLKRET